MAQQYPNLPGVNVELMDGNLRSTKQLSGPVTMIISTAKKGPSNVQYLQTDSNLSAVVFGADSPLIKRMNEAVLGGAKNVILYRIGGKAAELHNLWGQDTVLKTREEGADLGTKYKLYMGPSAYNPAVEVLIIWEGDQIVYSNAPGGQIDLGRFDVVGFAPTGIVIGTPTTPIPLKDVIASIAAPSQRQFSATADGTVSSFTIGTDATISGVFVDGNPAVEGSGEGEWTFAGGVVSFAPYTGQVNNMGDGVINTFFLPYTSTTIIDVNVDGVNMVDGVDYTFVQGSGGTNDAILLSASPNNGSIVQINYIRKAPLNGQDLLVLYSVPPASVPPNLNYQDGENGIGVSWKKLYELVDAALENIETTFATEVVLDQAIFDAPNVTDYDDPSLVPANANVLEFLRKTTNEVGENVYTWSRNKTIYQRGTGTTTNVIQADLDANGQPIVKESYSEVNFAHRLATWCHYMTEEERFINAVIGTSQPGNLTRQAINRWVGRLPIKDSLGAIVANGTGLLGNKYLAGTMTRKPGLFVTVSGFPDGNPVYDGNGVIVDAGKYLSIVPQSVFMGSNNEPVCAHAIYAGLIAQVSVGNSTTNMLVPGVALPYVNKKSVLNDFTTVGYVTFQNKERGVTVTSGELATANESDYTYISTSLIVAELVRSVRNALDPFIGKGLNQFTISAAETALETKVFQPLVRAGAIQKYDFKVVPPGSIEQRGKLSVPVTIIPAFELREINIPVKLAYEF